MSEESSGRKPPARWPSSVMAFLTIVTVLIAVLSLLQFWSTHPRSPFPTFACQANLTRLGSFLRTYADNHAGQFPPAQQWCNALIAYHSQGGGTSFAELRKCFRCPAVNQRGLGYAMNPLADPNSDAEVVLLFESDAGWNGCGGPELLATGRHGAGGCNVLFVDGSVRFVKREELTGLKWASSKATESDTP